MAESERKPIKRKQRGGKPKPVVSEHEGGPDPFAPMPFIPMPDPVTARERERILRHNQMIGRVNKAKAQARADLNIEAQRGGVPHEWSKEASSIVELGAAAGLTEEKIAALVPRYTAAQLGTLIPPPTDGTRTGITVECLKRWYGTELEVGQTKWIALMARNLVRIGTLGLTPGTVESKSTLGAITFFLKNRGGAAWREPDDVPDPLNPERGAGERRLVVEVNIGDAKGKDEAAELATADAAALALRKRNEDA